MAAGSGGSLPSRRVPSTPSQKIRMRFEFSKTGELRYLSHRELMTAVIRAVRRADIPVLYSQGFHPSPRIAFGPPLNVGVSGLKECFDMELQPSGGLTDPAGRLNRVLPPGIEIIRSVFIRGNEPSLQSFISRYEYEIICPDAAAVETVIAAGALVVNRGKTEASMVDIRDMVEDAVIVDRNTVRIILQDRGEKKTRLGEILPALFGVAVEELGITRLKMFGWRGGWVEPLPMTIVEEGKEYVK
jgi:radical SAM-linked protein